MKIIIFSVLSICLQSSPAIVDPEEKNDSSEEQESKSIEFIKDTQSMEETQILHGPAHKHKLLHYYKDDNLAFYGNCRRKFAAEALLYVVSKSKSAVCSPLSALMPLAKLALGSEGKGKEELLNAIGLSRRSKIKDKYRKLIRELKYLAGVEINLASQIFVSNKYRVRSTFREATEKIFGSSIKTVNFKDRKEAEATINSWSTPNVKFNYKLDGNERCIILNAITFKARWAQPFLDSRTKIFHSPTGDVFPPTMHREAMFNYFDSKDLDAQLVEIPYEKNAASFMVVLPHSRSGLPNLLKKLRHSPSALTHAIMQMTMKYTKVTLPKFSLSSQINMKSIFKSIGLSRVFGEHSGLKKIVRNKELTISWAFQATKIIVNEEGTTGVSSTDAQIKVILGSALEKTIFTANRPFLFFVKALGEQIFAGIYTGRDDSLKEGDLT